MLKFLFSMIALNAMAGDFNTFHCRSWNGDREVLAELHDDTVSITIKGLMVQVVAKEFTDKPFKYYEKFFLVSTTLEGCDFRPAWLNFQCTLHRYAMAQAIRSSGDRDHLFIGEDKTHSYKGSLIDYFDGQKHQIRVLLYREDHSEVYFDYDFAPEECRYLKQ